MANKDIIIRVLILESNALIPIRALKATSRGLDSTAFEWNYGGHKFRVFLKDQKGDEKTFRNAEVGSSVIIAQRLMITSPQIAEEVQFKSPLEELTQLEKFRDAKIGFEEDFLGDRKTIKTCTLKIITREDILNHEKEKEALSNYYKGVIKESEQEIEEERKQWRGRLGDIMESHKKDMKMLKDEVRELRMEVMKKPLDDLLEKVEQAKEIKDHYIPKFIQSSIGESSTDTTLDNEAETEKQSGKPEPKKEEGKSEP